MPWCSTCDRSFNTTRDYQRHLDYSPAHQEIECQFCDQAFNSRKALRQHLDNDNYQCSFCSSVFCSRSLREKHEKEPGYKCQHCDKAFCTTQILKQHLQDATGHPYCILCKRWFQNMNNLRSHQHSRAHQKTPIQCPFCPKEFTTASGVLIHLESGTCSSGLDRQKINAAIQRIDSDHVITRPMLTLQSYEGPTSATDRAWNGSAFECYLCPREFSHLSSLNQHLHSAAHEQKIYRCPKRSCQQEFKLLSGLVQHIESESCGVIRFKDLQRNARAGVGSIVRRMIDN